MRCTHATHFGWSWLRARAHRPTAYYPVEIAFMCNVSKRRRAVACSYRGEIAGSVQCPNTFKLFVEATSKMNIRPHGYFTRSKTDLYGVLSSKTLFENLLGQCSIAARKIACPRHS